MTTDRKYFATPESAKAELIKNKLFRAETNSAFDYCDDRSTVAAGIRSDVIGYWIEYRHFA